MTGVILEVELAGFSDVVYGQEQSQGSAGIFSPS